MSCEKCGDRPATEKIQRRLEDIAVGPPLNVCVSCAESLEETNSV